MVITIISIPPPPVHVHTINVQYFFLHSTDTWITKLQWKYQKSNRNIIFLQLQLKTWLFFPTDIIWQQPQQMIMMHWNKQDASTIKFKCRFKSKHSPTELYTLYLGNDDRSLSRYSPSAFWILLSRSARRSSCRCTLVMLRTSMTSGDLATFFISARNSVLTLIDTQEVLHLGDNLTHCGKSVTYYHTPPISNVLLIQSLLINC